ncbi:MAG: hypothetical protein ACJ74J_12230 [Blastocatellia bacterium]
MARSTDHIAKENKYADVSISPEELVRRRQADEPVWQMVLQIMRNVPEEEIDRLPPDGAEEHDHYIYGTPKKNS